MTSQPTYFRNLIDGLILAAPQAPSKGIPGNSIDVNIGSMRNTGVEIGLNGTILRKNKFTWSSSFNITFMSNEVLSLVDENSQILQATAGLETVSITKVGEPIGSIRAVETRGVNPATGQRIYVNAAGREVQYNHAAAATGRWTYLDGTVAPAISVITDGKIYGPTIPTWFGAWDHTFRYSSFDLNIQLQYSGGNLIYNGTKAGLRDMRFWNNHTDVLNRWQREGDVTNIPRVVYGDNISNGSAFPISENIERGDFLRVRNLALGYSLPRTLLNKANIANLRVYVMANNAFLFTQYTGTDPEVSTNGNENRAPGVDRNTVPMARTLTIGLNLGF